MKTEKEVKAMLKEAQKSLKQTEKQFEKYDNHEDMEEIDRLRREISTLEKVLA